MGNDGKGKGLGFRLWGFTLFLAIVLEEWVIF
jgi:hypothetical protein